MKLALALMAYSTLMLQDVRAEVYQGETHFEKKILKEADFRGPTRLNEVQAESLSVKGPLEFFNLIVEKDAKIEGPITKSENGKFGSLRIKGPLTAKNIISKTLEVVGSVDVYHLKVEGETNIVGSLKANQSQLENLNILADEIVLEEADVNNISIKKDKDKKQVLHLTGKTLVRGNIVFESGKGVIEQGPDVKIQGEIKGAMVQKK